MGHRHAMATAKVMRTAAFTGCASPHGDIRVRARTRPAEPARQTHHGAFEQPRKRRYIGQLKTSTSTVAGRSPWMNDRVTVLRRFLAELHGLHLPPELARVQVAATSNYWSLCSAWTARAPVSSSPTTYCARWPSTSPPPSLPTEASAAVGSPTPTRRDRRQGRCFAGITTLMSISTQCKKNRGAVRRPRLDFSRVRPKGFEPLTF